MPVQPTQSVSQFYLIPFLVPPVLLVGCPLVLPAAGGRHLRGRGRTLPHHEGDRGNADSGGGGGGDGLLRS